MMKDNQNELKDLIRWIDTHLKSIESGQISYPGSETLLDRWTLATRKPNSNLKECILRVQLEFSNAFLEGKIKFKEPNNWKDIIKPKSDGSTE